MKILFACDLDGTLIHSYKNFRDGDICVEIYDGREQSFISPRALDLLKKIAAQINFVPVTTRSIAQYRRIHWTEDFSPQIAVVANGAYLLDGKEQENFLRKVVKPYEEELNLQFKAADRNFFTIIRIVDESFLFLRCRDEINPEKIHFDTNLTVQRTGMKIYLFPTPLNKGNAVRLLAERFQPEKIICAGDSDIDLPMLELADVAFHEFTCAEDFLSEILSAATSKHLCS